MSSLSLLSVWVAGFSVMLPLLSTARYLSLVAVMDTTSASVLKLCIESVVCLAILEGRRWRRNASLDEKRASILAAAIRNGRVEQG